MAKSDAKQEPRAAQRTFKLRDFTGPPADEQMAEYQRILATNFGWQDGPRERMNQATGEMETVEFGQPHDHIAKTLLGVALRDLRHALTNQRLNEAREQITATLADEIPEL